MNSIKTYKLVISEIDHNTLYDHLFPGDDKEAAALIIGGRANFLNQSAILVHKIYLVPYSECKERTGNRLTWPISKYREILEEALKKGMAIMKIHSHPTGFDEFSSVDNQGDRKLFESIYGWTENDAPHASIIMLPDGQLLGRIITPDLQFLPLDRITIVGDDIKIINRQVKEVKNRQAHKRSIQAFGGGTMALLESLKIGVVGCSGTGSPIIEQLARLGTGELVIADPKKLREVNVSRIINSRIEQAEKEYKADILKKAIEEIGLGTNVRAYSTNLYDDLDLIKDLSTCDVIFGCMDSYDGRHLLSLIAAFYLIPYFDIGVDLRPDDKGNIDQITGCIHYIQPKKSSLRTRGVYNDEKLRTAVNFRTNPEVAFALSEEGYLSKVGEDRPAVISINMNISSLAINDFLARIHTPSFRYESNGRYAFTTVDYSDWRMTGFPEMETDKFLLKNTGRGDMTPPLNLPELSMRR